jgi:malate dehydrogenase (oxaloacetate-decarboxylating)(NADP+)
LLLQGKSLSEAKLVTSGAGAAALACVDLLVSMGLRVENVTLTDVKGVVRSDRPGMLANMARYARETNANSLQDVLAGADVFLGLSAPRVLKPEWLALLADKPMILALANPDPEIDPHDVRVHRADAIMATGRSDYPNQVNNVLCFPFIFRGALDVSATTINEAMKIAAVEAIAGLARVEASEVVAAAYGGHAPVFGPDYIIPRPFDPRLILDIAPAVARAAMESGVARRPIKDFDAYRRDLEKFVFRSGSLMRPVFEAAARNPKRIVFAEGEDERILRAAQTLIDDGTAHPILLGRHAVIKAKVKQMGLRMELGRGVEVLDPAQDDDVFQPLVPEYQRLVGRRGTPPASAARRVGNRPSVAAAMLLHAGLADAAICGGTGAWWRQIQYILPIIPRRADVSRVYGLSCVVLPNGVLFLCDTYMVLDPTAEQIAEMTLLAADAVHGFGITPKAALVSHSSFGASDTDSARKMRRALAMIRERAPSLEIDGEMHADAALVQSIRNAAVPDSRLTGTANLLIMPNLDSANIGFNLLKAAADGLPIGPMLLGMTKPIHVVVPSVTARGIVNLSALAVVEAQEAGDKAGAG